MHHELMPSAHSCMTEEVLCLCLDSNDFMMV